MIERSIDLWKAPVDVRCITTNGSVTPVGLNVMGGGCAREAAERRPTLPLEYGQLIEAHGNHVFLIGGLVMFPVKRQVSEGARLDLIERSAHELVTLTDLYDWDRVAVPRPGCGLGGLSWDDVRPVLEDVLDDRFLIVDFAPVMA